MVVVVELEVLGVCLFVGGGWLGGVDHQIIGSWELPLGENMFGNVSGRLGLFGTSLG